MRKTFTRISTAVAVFIAAIAWTPALLGLFGWQFAEVTTGSMEPTMPVGSILAVMPTDEMTLGEPVMFQHEGAKMPVTHRVIALDDGVATTQGDANNSPDATPVTASEVIGKPVLTMTGPAADAFAAAQTISGRIAIGALILLLLMPSLTSKPNPKTSTADGQPPTTEPLEAS